MTSTCRSPSVAHVHSVVPAEEVAALDEFNAICRASSGVLE